MPTSRPPEVITALFAKTQEGYDVVTARRTSREDDTLIKRVVSTLGCAVINEVADIDIPRHRRFSHYQPPRH
jgi:polyisoprenyl-phosphate glycosyltransferase